MENEVNEKLRQSKMPKPITPVKIGHYSETLKDLPNINDLNKREQSIVIFYDFLSDHMQSPIEDYFIRS